MRITHHFKVAIGVSLSGQIVPAGIALLVMLLALAASTSSALAANGTWINTTTGGLWSITMNWSGSIVANGTDAIADFSTLNITADDTVHLDSARTIGQLKFGDTTPSNNWILDNNGSAANILTLAVSAGSPTISVNNDVATISAVLAGTQGVTEAGAGTLVLNGNNTYTGGTTLGGGTLKVATIADSGNSNLANSGALTFSGGTLEVTGNGNVTARTVSVSSGSGTIQIDGGNSLTLNGSVGVVFGPTLNVVMPGGGALILGGLPDNSSLALNVQSGTVALAKTSSASVHAVALITGVSAGATVQLAGPGGDQIYDGSGFGVSQMNGTLDFNGRNEGFDVLGGTGTVLNNGGGTSTMTLGTGGSASSFAGTIADNNGGGGKMALVKTGFGTLTLSGNNTFTGGTTINAGAGMLQLGSAGAVQNSTVTLLATNGLAFSPGIGTFNLGGLSGVSSFALTDTGAGSVAISVGADGDSTTYSGVLSGGGSLSKIGAGTLTLSGNNTFTGGTTLSAGTLKVATIADSGNSNLANSGTLFIAGGTLEVTGAGNVTGRTVDFIGSGTIQIDGGNSLTLNGPVLTPFGPVTNIVMPSGGTLTFGGTADNSSLLLNVQSGALVLAKTSSVVLSIHGAAEITGVNVGATVRLAGTGGDQIYDGTGFGMVQMNGTLDFNGRSEGFDLLSGTGTVLNNGSGTSTMTVGTGGSDSSFAGTIADNNNGGGGTMALVKIGVGTLRLSGNNTFTGGTIVGGGTLESANNAALATTSSVGLISAGSTLAVNYGGASDYNQTQVVALLGKTTFAAGTAFGFDTNNAVGAVTYGNAISIAAGITKLGAGTLTLSGNNTFTGGVTINGGTLQVGSAGALNSAAPNLVTFGFGSNGLLALNGFSITVSGLTTNPVTGTPAVQNGNAAPATLTVNNPTSNSFAGVLQDGPGGGALSLTKTGSGILALSGNNTFTGLLNINGGMLAESGGAIVANVHDQAGFIYNSGVFGGRLFLDGTFTLNADFTAGGGMQNDIILPIPTGRTIALNGTGLDNEATLSLSGTLVLGAGNSHFNQGEIDLLSGSTLGLASGATLMNNATLNLSGGIVSGPGGTLVNNGTAAGTGAILSNLNNAAGLLLIGSGPLNANRGLTNSGIVQLTAAASVLSGGAVANSGTIFGLGNVSSAVTNTGTLQASGGLLLMSGSLTNQVTGLMTVDAGARLTVSQGLATNVGVININGGTFENNNHPLNNTGEISGFGVFRTGGAGLDNNGSITFTGGPTTVNGPVTNENGKTIVVAYNPAIFTGLVTNNGGGTFHTTNTTITFAGGFTNNGNSNFASAGNGTIDILVAPSLGGGSSLAVGDTSTLRFSAGSGAATVGTGVMATVTNGATLELAGSVSALSAGSHRVNITNNSSPNGILVSGTHQQVGNINGAGTTQVNAGSDLTANHIIQSALVIGGMSNNPGLVTIDASDASGNPLTPSSGFAMAGSLTPSGPFGAGGVSSANSSSSGSGDPAALSMGNSVGGANPSSVPEPSTLLLVLVGIAGLAGQGIASRRRARRDVY
jgi:fibronectin-binding autotransporter adhesin